MTRDPTPADRIAELESENEELRSGLERLGSRQERAFRGTRAVGGLGVRILAGPALWSNSRAWFEKLALLKSPRDQASPEIADLVTALAQRVVRVGFLGLLAAAVPMALVLIQIFLLGEQNASIREQNAALQTQIEQQASDTLIVRRAQLLATIYEESCTESESSLQEDEDIETENQQTSKEPDDSESSTGDSSRSDPTDGSSDS